jgi:altronate dehydratase small subunit
MERVNDVGLGSTPETYILYGGIWANVMPERYIKVVQPVDNVGTLIRETEEGETLEIQVGDEVVKVRLNDEIPFGHKVALRDIEEGETVVKYGTSIGYASKDIEAGDWIHVHNVDSNYGRGDLAEDDAAQTVSE